MTEPVHLPKHAQKSLQISSSYVKLAKFVRSCVWSRIKGPLTIGARLGQADHVPTRSGACSLRSAARTERAVIRPVLGFSDGTFSIANVKRAEAASTSIE